MTEYRPLSNSTSILSHRSGLTSSARKPIASLLSGRGGCAIASPVQLLHHFFQQCLEPRHLPRRMNKQLFPDGDRLCNSRLPSKNQPFARFSIVANPHPVG